MDRRLETRARRVIARLGWLALLVAVSASCGEQMRPGDYLSPELRGRVEQLKADVARNPTSSDTAEQRASVLWEWMNAYSLTGREMNVDVPLVVARVLGYDARAPDLLQRLDMFVHELQVREERPDAIDTLSTNATGPFPAGSYQTIEQTYTVGNMPMLPGGGVLVGRRGDADHFQPPCRVLLCQGHGVLNCMA